MRDVGRTLVTAVERVEGMTAGAAAEPQVEAPASPGGHGSSARARPRRRTGRDPRTQVLGDLYPFASHYVELGGPRMHYLDEGDGPPLVLLHGNPTWSFYYRALVMGLRDRYRVIVPDHIGCGLSDKPVDYPYTLSTHVANLEKLIESLELGEVTLGMHDWGGPIGLGWAARHVEQARRFVLFNTAAFLGGRLPRRIAMCRPAVVGEVLVQGLNAFVRGSFLFGSVRRLARDVRRGYLLPYDSIGHRVGLLRFVRDIPVDEGVPSYAAMRQIESALPALRDRPVVLFWGMRDFCFNERFLHQWMLRLPRASVHCYADAGHYVVEDAHERILPELASFLEETA